MIRIYSFVTDQIVVDTGFQPSFVSSYAREVYARCMASVMSHTPVHSVKTGAARVRTRPSTNAASIPTETMTATTLCEMSPCRESGARKSRASAKKRKGATQEQQVDKPKLRKKTEVARKVSLEWCIKNELLGVYVALC